MSKSPFVASPLSALLTTLDFSPGGPLNPLVGNPGQPNLVAVRLDATADTVQQDLRDGSVVDTSISALAGLIYSAGDPLLLVSPASGTYVLGGLDDVVVLPSVQQSRDLYIDGGGGFDTLLVPAGRQDTVTPELSQVEALVFDPATPADVTNQAGLSLAHGELPTLSVVGSPGTDRLLLSIGPSDLTRATGVRTVLDLRQLDLQGLDAGQGDLMLAVVSPSPGVPGLQGFDVVADPALSLTLTASIGTAVSVTGSDQPDQVWGADGPDQLLGGGGDDVMLGGPGADTLAGGADRDMASYASTHAGWAPVQVDLADGLPERGGDAQGDLLVDVEDLMGTEGGDTLLGDAADNHFQGLNGSDQLDGRGGDDELIGATGSDVLTGGPGNDRLVGGYAGDPAADVDTAVFSGARSDYAVRRLPAAGGGSGLELQDQRPGSPDGTDQVFDVDLYRFSDGTYTAAQLLALPSTVALVRADAGAVREGQTLAAGGMLAFELRRDGDVSLPATVGFMLDAPPGSSLGADDIATVADGGNGIGAGLGRFEATFAPGQTTKTVFVIAAGDRLPEDDEAVRLTLVDARGATLSTTGVLSATGTFANDDVVPELRFTSANAGSAAEGNEAGAGGRLEVTIERTGDLSYESVAFVSIYGGQGGTSSSDIATVVANGIGMGSEFGTYSVAFAPGEASQTLTVIAAADRVPEGDEGIVFTLFLADVGTLAASGPLSATGTFTNDDVLPELRFSSASAGSVAEGNVPGAGGRLAVTIERTGDLSYESVAYVNVDAGQGGTSSSDIDTVAVNGVGLGSGFGTYGIAFAPGVASQTLTVIAAGDRVPEGDEGIVISLLAADLGTLAASGPLSATGTFTNDDVALQFPLLIAAREAREGQPWALTIEPQPAGVDPSTLQVDVDWGDGSPALTLSGTELAALQGVLLHTFADDEAGPVDRSLRHVQVQVGDLMTQQTVSNGIGVDVVDVAPSLGTFGFTSPWVEHHASATLTVGSVIDVAADPVLGLYIDWGDGQPPEQVQPGPATHSYATLGTQVAKAYVVNDDGTFEVARSAVSVTATAGHAAPNGTPAQWAAAWTDSLMRFSHKADLDNPAEAWTPVTLSAVNSGVLAGGDLYGGLLGVSGRTAVNRSVRQEIDGTEALRIELAPGTHANAVIIDLARLFTGDASGQNEAGMVMLYDGSTLVGSHAVGPGSPSGRLQLPLLGGPEFDTVVIRASAGGDFMLESLQFMNLPDVPLVGLAADVAP